MNNLETIGRVLALGLVLVSTPVGVLGQTPDSDRTSSANPGTPLPNLEQFGLLPGRPRVSPTRTDTPPRIDGVLDDEVWRTAAHITQFTQQAPLDGAPATEDTDVYIAYDSEHIYFGFHAHYKDPSIMRANRGERDRAMRDDLMTIYLDTFLDQQRGYDFDVNGYGVQGDGVMTAGGRGGRGGRGSMAIPPADRSWDALFDTSGRIVDDGFVAEMAIPFKSLRYPTPRAGEPHRWGFQIVREVKSKDEENQVWAPMSRDETSFFAQMGLLEGMTDLSTSRNLEILPTVTAIQYGSIDPTRPAFVNQATDPDAGVNVKYGITSNLTADFTVNPDFSQIESDRQQIEVNQRFPLFFSELRPFFVEGSEIFSITAPVTFVHTRTIVDPDYGAKLTGQVGRISLGALTANDRAPGRVDDPNDPAFDRTAQTFIGRALVDLYAESNVGAIFTDREFLDGHSRTFGVNGNFRFSPIISGDLTAVGSWHKDAGATDQTTGDMVSTRISSSGRSLGWSVNAYQISPEFETDVGFVRRRDQRNIAGNVRYRFWPESWIINWGPSLNYSRNYDFDGVLEDENFGSRLEFSFARSISLNGGFDRDMERFGGIDFDKTSYSFGGRVNTSRTYEFGGNFSFGDEIYYAGLVLGRQLNWSLNGTVRPTSALSAGLNFTSRRLTDPTNGGAEIFGVQIFRAQTTYQITDRLGVRNITEFNTADETVDLNILFNYRVNSGTVLYLGYDDHYQQADLIEGDMDGDGAVEQLFFTNNLRRTNRAIFAKFQYLIRY
ncbi:MAG: carbohydrate binding family 9 domain-containing protein [Gemmatimonadota bacterium]|nr:carbohydrate binding family 9 domain-containing protein [Gemmatimonadota bacterium]MDH3422596.1 carbohydrate binding family 9 domain-containing protein [Gemmatimonadota bacterium]